MKLVYKSIRPAGINTFSQAMRTFNYVVPRLTQCLGHGGFDLRAPVTFPLKHSVVIRGDREDRARPPVQFRVANADQASGQRTGKLLRTSCAVPANTVHAITVE